MSFECHTRTLKSTCGIYSSAIKMISDGRLFVTAINSNGIIAILYYY